MPFAWALWTLLSAAGCEAEAPATPRLGPTPGPGDDPSCHYDCFGSPRWTCEGGTVSWLRNAPVPCAYLSMLPADRPVCTIDTWACEGTASCAGSTPYQACVANLDGVSNREASARLVRRALCASGALKEPGAACASDEDCRPADVDGAHRLHCNGATGRCTLAPRPPAPSLREPCGPPIAPGSLAVALEVESALCMRCLALPGAGCVASVCTTPCDFDDDCPTGWSCACAPGGLPSRLGVCVPGLERSLRAAPAVSCEADVDAGGAGDAAADVAGDAGAVDAAGAVGCEARAACAVGRCDDPGHLGVAWDGRSCVALRGCRCEGAGCAMLHPSVDACLLAHAGCGGREHARCINDAACAPGERCVPSLRDPRINRCAPVSSGCVGVP